jgi:hypothetical protein
MAQKLIFVCDRCGQPRAVALEVDVAQTVVDDVEQTATAKLDLCWPCVAEALKQLMTRTPVETKRAWYEWLRVLGREE